MPDSCTCGAQLPPDARFCHRCGRPLREDDQQQPVSEAPPPPLVIPPALAPAPLPWTAAGFQSPSFRNPLAVRIAWLAASVATLLNMLLPYGFIIWLVAAGFFSVYLFGRRTGQGVTVRSGARMGWITGILSYAIFAVLFVLQLFAMTRSGGGLAGIYREQVSRMPVSDPKVVEEATRLLETTGGQAMLLGTLLVILFGMVTILCIAGGALGAKVLAKE